MKTRLSPKALAPVRSMSRDKILDVAERAFAEHGYEACTLRMISDESGANLSLVPYYFGTKEGLFAAVFLRRAKPLAARRMALLSEAREKWGARPIPVEEIVRCFITPTVELMATGRGGRAFISLFARFRAETHGFGPSLRGEAFNETNAQFIKELQRSCPQLSKAAVVWRLSAMVGAYYSVISQGGRLDQMSNGLCDPNDIAAAIAQVIPFAVAGFSAPDAREPFVLPAAKSARKPAKRPEPKRRRPPSHNGRRPRQVSNSA